MERMENALRKRAFLTITGKKCYIIVFVFTLGVSLNLCVLLLQKRLCFVGGKVKKENTASR